MSIVLIFIKTNISQNNELPDILKVVARDYPHFHPTHSPDLIELYRVDTVYFESFDLKDHIWVISSANSPSQDVSKTPVIHFRNRGVKMAPDMPLDPPPTPFRHLKHSYIGDDMFGTPQAKRQCTTSSNEPLNCPDNRFVYTFPSFVSYQSDLSSLVPDPPLSNRHHHLFLSWGRFLRNHLSR